MVRVSKFVVIWMLVALMLLAGCNKKRKTQIPPPVEEAPLKVEPPPLTQQPAQAPAPLPAPPPAAVELPSAPAPKPKRKKKVAAHKTAPATPDKKPAAASGSTPPASSAATPSAPAPAQSGGQLAAEVSAAETRHQRQSAAQLQATAEANLHSLNRSLSSDEQEMVQQARSYLQQSRAAQAEGDPERAYNLAFKANLLSKELAKR